MTEAGSAVLDQRCAEAVDIAREALNEDVPVEHVGDHIEAIAEADLLVTHLFECKSPAYVGWRWAVTVNRAEGSDDVTVAEIVLLPGPDSILAPTWLPWQDRVQAGDLGVGDVLPTADDDPRLVPGYTGADMDDTYDDDLTPVMWELGLGRIRVLSSLGRDEAAERWISGENGPLSPMARAASEQCSTCGFLIMMTGPLGRAFGLCGNEFSPADGSVVALDHGCGAHSEAEPEPPPVVVVDLVVDDLSAEGLDTTPLPEEPEPEPVLEAEPEAELEPVLEAEPETESDAPTEGQT